MDHLACIASNVELPEDYSEIVSDLSYQLKHSTGPMKRFL